MCQLWGRPQCNANSKECKIWHKEKEIFRVKFTRNVSFPEARKIVESPTPIPGSSRGGRVVRWSWVNFQCRGVLLVWIRVGQGPTALAVGAGGLFGHFYSHLSFLFFLPLFGRRPDID